MLNEGLDSPSKQGIAHALSQVATHGDRLMNGDSGAREMLVASARELVVAAETPMETLLWNIWALVSFPGPACKCRHANWTNHSRLIT